MKRRLKKLSKGKLRPVFRGLYRSLSNSQLGFERLADMMNGAPNSDPLLGEITAVIKTFERPDKLGVLLKSIKRLYPTLHVIVVDDSEKPIQIDGVENIHLSYDRGVSEGRQAGLDAVKTKYVLNLDDDYIFTRKTDLMSSLNYLDNNINVDIVAGRVIYLPYYTELEYLSNSLMKNNRSNLIDKGTNIGGLIVYEKTANFWLGRTEKIKTLGWDKGLKRLDHADFFTRAKGVLVTVYNPEMQMLHMPTHFNDRYMVVRHDYSQDSKVLRDRYEIR